MAGIGSFLGGVGKGMESQKALDLKSEEIANDKALRSRGLDIQQARNNFLSNQENQKALDTTVQSIWQSMVNTHDRFADAGHAPQDAEPAIQSLSQHAVDLLNLAGLKDKAAAFQEQTKALVSTPAKDTAPKYEPAGTNMGGQTIYAQVNPSAPGGISKPEQLTAQATDFIPKDANGNLLSGKDVLVALAKSDPSAEATVEMYLTGRLPMPSQFARNRNPALQQYLVLAHRVDPSFDPNGTNSSRKKAAEEFASSKPTSPGGAINGGLGAIAHLGEWLDHVVKIGNIDSSIPGVAYLANEGGYQLAASKQQTGEYVSADAAAGKFAPEVTKLYTGSGGTGEERKSEIKDLNSRASPSQQASVALTNVKLMLEKLDKLGDRYHQEVTPEFDAPIMTPSTIRDLDRIFGNVLKLDPSKQDEINEIKARFYPESALTQTAPTGEKAIPPAGGQNPPAPQAAVPEVAAPSAPNPQVPAAAPQTPGQPPPAQQGAAPNIEEMKADYANMSAALAKVATLPPAQQAAAKLAILNALHAKYGTPTMPQQPSQGTMP